MQYIPGQSDYRLELLLLAMKRTIRWEQGVTQEDAIRSLAGRRNHVRENLGFPSQTIAQAEIRQDLPLVLSEECVVLIVDARSPRLYVNQARRHAILKVEDKRPAHTTTGCARLSLVLGDPTGERSGARETLAHRRTKPTCGVGGRVPQKPDYAVEDVASGKEPAEYLGVVRVKPVAAKLETMFAVND